MQLGVVNLLIGLTFAACVCAIGTTTRLLSSRPRIFIRLFVPRDEVWPAARNILRGPGFNSSTRVIAAIELFLGLGIAIVVVACWLLTGRAG